MRTAVTLARQHDEENLVVVTGPEVPIHEQRQAFRDLLSSGHTHPEIAEAQLWESDQGIARRARFEPAPEEVPDSGTGRKRKSSK